MVPLLGLLFLQLLSLWMVIRHNWGASIGDVAANASGTALYVSQELLWKEQRIVPKFSFIRQPMLQFDLMF
jgi:hypothetical protein